MISNRPYREAVSIEQALNELRKCAGKQFDPAVVDAFGEYVEEIRPMMRSSASALAPRQAQAQG
jgi:HD-GYP domain-containing protein (c-di-GMP phosphodiesterase class II)